MQRKTRDDEKIEIWPVCPLECFATSYTQQHLTRREVMLTQSHMREREREKPLLGARWALGLLGNRVKGLGKVKWALE